MYIKILCDDRYDKNLTYQIESEEVGKYHADECEGCMRYSECHGWAKVFERCEGAKYNGGLYCGG